jgi:phosphatidate cytidylyltransferase
MLPLVAWPVWAGGWWLFAGIGLVAAGAAYEFVRLMRQGGHTPWYPGVLAIIGLFFLDVQFPALQAVPIGLAWVVMLSLAWQLLQAGPATPTVDWALTMAGGVYLGVLSAHFIRLRALPDPYGLAWTSLGLLVTWSSDSGAYLVGRAWGRRKLCPRLSPGKTWEGTAGGLVAALGAGGLVGYLLMLTLGAVGPVHGLIVGLLVAIMGPLGDLAESMMKREANAKDSGTLIPGHGGVWDRIDSLLFVIPVTYYYAIWVAGRS